MIEREPWWSHTSPPRATTRTRSARVRVPAGVLPETSEALRALDVARARVLRLRPAVTLAELQFVDCLGRDLTQSTLRLRRVGHGFLVQDAQVPKNLAL